MNRIPFILAAICFTISAAFAQFNGCSTGFCKIKAVTSTFVGIGDVGPTFKSYHSVNHCFSNSYNGNIADIWDSATGSTTETLLKCTTGGVISQTVNPLSTTCALACNIKTLYDMSGTNSCSGAPCDMVQATNASRFTYTANASGGKACAHVNWFAAANYMQAANPITTLAQAFSSLAVANRGTSAVSARQIVWSIGTAGPRFAYSNVANSMILWNTSLTSPYISSPQTNDLVYHRIFNLFNGGSSNIVSDLGSAGGALNPGTGGTGTIFTLGDTSFTLDGYICEVGMMAGDQSSSNASFDSINKAFYGL